MDEGDEERPKGGGGVEGGGSTEEGIITESGKSRKKGGSVVGAGETSAYNIDDNGTLTEVNNGGSMSSATSTIYAREDSNRSEKSVTISFCDSIGEEMDTRCTPESATIGWRYQGGYRGASSAGRPLKSILENVRDQGTTSPPSGIEFNAQPTMYDSDSRRSIGFSRDLYNKPAFSGHNNQLLAVSYPLATAEEKKNKNIKVSN